MIQSDNLPVLNYIKNRDKYVRGNKRVIHHCQMTKPKQFGDQFDILHLRGYIRGLGECSTSQTVEYSSQGIWDKSKFYRALATAYRNRS